METARASLAVSTLVTARWVKRNQIVDTIYLVQWEVWVDSMGIGRVSNEPSTAYPALEFIPVERMGSVHDKLKVVERVLLSVNRRSHCIVRVDIVKPRQYALLFRPLEV